MIDKIKNIKHIDSNNFFLIAGPCAIEGEEMAGDASATAGVPAAGVPAAGVPAA